MTMRDEPVIAATSSAQIPVLLADSDRFQPAFPHSFDRDRGVNRAHDRVMQLMPAGTFMYATPASP